MSVDTLVLAAATVIAPAVAVGVAYFFQRSLLKQQQQLQSAVTKEMEESRRDYEKARAEAEQRLWLNWKAADRDRFVELTNELKKIAKALDSSVEKREEATRFR